MTTIGISILLFIAVFFIITMGYGVRKAFHIIENTGIIFISLSFLMIYLLIVASLDLLKWGTLGLWVILILFLLYIIIKERINFIAYIKSNEIQLFLWTSIAFIVLFAVTAPFFIAWDEFSHWGPFYKSIKETGRLHIFLDREFVHQAYPQGISLLFYGLTFPISEFSEEAVYCIYAIIIIACSLTILPSRKYSKGFMRIVVPLATVLMYFLFPYISPYSTVYLDTLLGAYFGACIIMILKFQNIDQRKVFIIVVNIAALMQIKDISVIFALICIFVFFLRYYIVQKEKIVHVNTLYLIGSFLLSLSWWKIALFLTQKADDQFSNLKMSDLLYDMIDFIKSGKNYFGDVLYAYGNAIMHREIIVGGVSTFSAFLLLCILSVYIVLKTETLVHKFIVAIFPCFFIGYCLAILIVYEIAMSPSEALSVNSYERYISTFFIAWILLIISEYIRINRISSIHKGISLSALLCICIISIILHDGFKINVSKDDTGRTSMDKIALECNEFLGKDKNIWYVTESALERYSFRYLLMPSEVNMAVPLLSESIYCDFITITQSNNIDYLLLWQLPDYFIETYGEMFDNTLSWLRYDVAGIYIYDYSEQKFQLMHLIIIS